MMPGTRLLEFARRWFPLSTVSSVFEPLVADWQRQWSEATLAERRWINVKGRVAFATALMMTAPRVALTSGTLRARLLIVAGTFWFATAILLLVPFAQEGWPLALLWLLLPAHLTLMLPFAILPAIDAMRRNSEEPAAADRRGAIMLVVVAVCVVAVGQGWVTPAANQHFRNEAASHVNGHPTVVPRGLREMTTAELIVGDATNTPALNGTPRVRELNMRLTLAVLPALLAWLRWRALSRPRKRSWPVVKSCLLAIAATFAFFTVMTVGAALEPILVPGFGPVMALALLAATTRTGIWWRQRAA